MAACLALTAGCSGSGGPATYPVSGTVTFDSKPVEGAQVTFMAPGAPRAAVGKTDSQGKFRLTTFKLDDGAVPGTHAVTIVKMETSGQDISADKPGAAYGAAMKAAAAGKKRPAQPGGIPGKYSDPKLGGLTAEVKKGGSNEFTFDLKR
jgi:hypothetical protein